MLHFEKKILGMEKKSNDFVTFPKKIWVREKKSNIFVTFRKKNFGYGKKFFLKMRYTNSGASGL